jgi:hypothetical protein
VNDSTRQPASDNPDLRRLDVLIGEWTVEPWVDGKPTGLARTTFAWSAEGNFVVQRTESLPVVYDLPQAWVENAPFPTTAILGLDDGSHEFTMLYNDARDVFRVYQVQLTDRTWNIWRASPGFHQRFTGTFAEDGNTIDGFWEFSEDGRSWALDFNLKYSRIR